MSGSNAPSASALSASDITTLDGEPRIVDLRIAERLGFARQRAIRDLIDRNRDELLSYGPLAARRGKSRGQSYSEFHLNEGQTLLVCMLARTPQAAAVRKEVIDAYIAFRRPVDPLEGFGSVRIGGELVHFDGRLDAINQKDGVVAMLPRPDTPTLQLTVVTGPLQWVPDKRKTFGDRSVYRLSQMPGTRITQHQECIAIGRVISRTPIEPDGGAA
ncbi:hypothetical protein [Fodinicurvata sp. EGI_FJ10296]|uniref:hypothetical protein n=1 Tax=Fodinicurvata sp. EGI_FJ10296 TaxID=3231908 RepID=UPI0034547EE4